MFIKRIGYKTLLPLLRVAVGIGVVLATMFPPRGVVSALPVLTVTPITWNVIGLDSNNVNVGPNHFPVGARVCNTGDATATNLVATLNWDSSNSYINIRSGTNSTLSVSSLAAGSCTDFYFEVEITRDSNAYNTTRRYHINVSADGGISVNTPTPRELLVEYLVSQSRNAVTDVQYGTSLASLTSVASGGTMTLVVGNTYYIKLIGFTATNGYEQLESFINFPNTIFQVLSVSTTYTADSSSYVSSPNDKAYGDACKWENDPGSPNYRACLDVGKVGSDITVTYQIKILQVPSSPLTNPEPLSTLVYDFSGSSYHYNSDFSVSTRYAHIVNASITKSFSPKTINPGGTSTLTFTITNPGTNSISSVNFTDSLPSNLTISSTTVTYSGCGSPSPPSLTVGATSLSFSSITVSGLSTCSISVSVTSSTDGTYNNTTSSLLIGATDTGSSGSDILIVSSLPAPPSSCTTPSTMATWTLENYSASTSTNNGPFSAFSQASDVSTATGTYGSASGSSSGIANTTTFPTGWSAPASSGNSGNSWGIRGGWLSSNPASPTTATTPYFQFQVDGSNYGGIGITASYNLQGNWSNSGNWYVLSSTDGSTWSSANTALWDKSDAWQSNAITATTTITGNSTVYFRVFAAGAQYSGTPSTTTGTMYLDGIQITGCPRPSAPTLSKSFSPTSIATGNTSTLTFTLTNPNSTTSLTGVSFSDVLPSGLTVSSSTSSACSGGTLTLTAPRTISLTGGTIAASGTCTINVTVTGAAAGSYTNVSSSVSSTQTGPNTASSGYGTSSLTVVDPPVIVKSFTANPIFTNDTTTLSFTITNPNTAIALTGVNFSDSLPSSLEVANPNGLSTTCSGTTTATAGSTTVSLSGASLAASASCTISVSVKGTSAGLKTNSVTVSSTNGGTGNTSAASVLVKDPTPLISLLKQVGSTSSGPWTSFLAVSTGANVYYKFTVENTGDVALSSVNVTDSTLSLASCTWTDGDGTVLTAPFALPVADASDNQLATCVLGPFTASSGLHPNTATASGTYSSTTVTDTSTATYGTTGLTLAKSVTEAYFTTAGDLLHYSYLVTNSGYASLLGPVTVSDNKATVTCPAVSTVGDGDDWLDVGESLTCTATYTVTASDVTTGSVTNTASATAGGVTSNTDSKTVSVPSDLTVTKTDDTSGSVALGNSFNWTITTSNTSATDIASFADTQIIMSDTLPGASGYYPQGALTVTNGVTPPTGTINCSITGTALSCVASGTVTLPASASFSVTFAVTPTAAGSLANTATVDPNGNVTETDETNNTGSDTVTVIAPPSISKSFSPDPIFINGTTTLTFTITNPNTGTALTGVGFSDSLPSGLQVASPTGASTSGCGSPTFSPSSGDTSLTFSGGDIVASGTCTVSVDVTGTTSGVKNNTSNSVSSTNGGTGNTASDSLTVNPLIDVSLDKQVSNATPNVGDTVTFTLVIANAGPSTATNIVMTDVVPSGYTYVTSSISGGDTRNDSNPSTSGLTWTINSLANGASVNLTYQAQVLASGTYDNYAEITSHTETDSDSTPGNTSTTEDDDDTVAVTPTPVADLAITKTDGVTSVSTGSSTTYIVRVTNNGPSSVSGAILSDPAAPGLTKTAVACSATPGQCVAAPTVGQLEGGTFALPVLASGQFYEITVSASVTASSGSVTNAASVAIPVGAIDSDNTNNSASDTDTVTSAPGLTLTKSITSGDPYASVGDVLSYSFLVQNTGNVSLTGPVTVNDDKATDESCPAVTTVGNLDNELDPGESITCTATYTVTQSDIDSGSVTNTATASADGVDSNQDQATANATQTPSIAVVKEVSINSGSSWQDANSAPGPYLLSGMNPRFRFTVTNTGNVTLSNLTLNDSDFSTAGCSVPATLAPAASFSCTLTETWVAGQQTDTATTSSVFGGNTYSDTDDANYFGAAPALSVVKEVSGDNGSSWQDANSAPGPSIASSVSPQFRFTVTNTGNVTLSALGLTDSDFSTATCSIPGTLAAGGTFSCTLTEAWAAGQQSDTATASGQFTDDNGNTNATSGTDDANYFGTLPALALVKSITSGDPYDTLGGTINYQYVVTNSGNVSLAGPVTITDDKTSATCPNVNTVGNNDANLDPGESITCTASYTVTQNDLDSGSVINTAAASADGTVSNQSQATATATQMRQLTLDKTTTSGGFNAVNDTLDYSYQLTNSGNVTLYPPYAVSDNKATVTCPATPLSLAPGVSVTCTATYLITQADLDAGSVVNIATATAKDAASGGNDVTSNQDSVTVNGTQSPAYTITKTITSSGPYDSAGDVITYQVVVTNTGNVTLTGVSVTDTLLSNLDCDASTPGNQTSGLTVNVGSSLTCTGSYTLTQNDLDTNGGGDGDIDNTASVTSTQIPAPQTSSAAAPLTHPTGFFDPPFGQKVLNAELLPELEWKMVWINNSNNAAINVQITDPIPAGTTYVLNSLSCVANNASSTTSCLYDSVQNRIFWQGVIAPDPGATDELSANNEVVIIFRVTVPDTLNQVDNQGSSLTDTDGDGSFTDETDPAVSVSVSNIATWSRNTGGGGGGAGGAFRALPSTGFAPGRLTELPAQSSDEAYTGTDIWLEIPSLGVRTTIVGVPNADGTWDVSWLWRQIGWLQGTAFPSWSGNSVLTGHVYLSDGEPGPFVDLHKLGWGDRIIIHAYGSKYIYEVRENLVVKPEDLSVLRHEDDPWITLLTCQGYNEAADSYAHRVAVRAVLIKVMDDLSTTVRDKR